MDTTPTRHLDYSSKYSTHFNLHAREKKGTSPRCMTNTKQPSMSKFYHLHHRLDRTFTSPTSLLTTEMDTKIFIHAWKIQTRHLSFPCSCACLNAQKKTLRARKITMTQNITPTPPVYTKHKNITRCKDINNTHPIGRGCGWRFSLKPKPFYLLSLKIAGFG